MSLQFSYSVSGRVFNWLGYDPPQSTRGAVDHHDHSHDWDLTEVSSNHLSDIDRWYGEQVAYLVAQLDAVQDGDALLDNSVLAWGNEMGRGGHSLDDAPFLLAGGAGALSMGKNFDLRGSDLRHNRLLVSLGRAMGLELDQFGTLDEGSGGLSGLEV